MNDFLFKRFPTGMTFAVLAILTLAGPHRSAAESRPNVLFILVDDLGWSDLGCYGHPWHRTPNIDALAASGIRLSNGYAPAPICSASRASLLTGKSTARLGFEFVTKDRPGRQKIEGDTELVAPPFTINLPLAERTIPEHLNDLGYETAFFGKWHLNQHYQRYLGWSPTHGPRAQGFRVAVEDFGAHPYSWKKNPPTPIRRRGEFAPDSMVDQVCRYLADPPDQPYFVMASSFYVHTPVKTPCQWLVDHYEAMVPADSPNRSKRVTYAAFVETLDHHVGQIMAALDASGKRDETLVVMMSDNGGHPEYTSNEPLRGSKWNLYEGGIRVPFLASWPGQITEGSESDHPVTGYDLLPTFVEIAGGEFDQALEGEGNRIDGVSIRSVLTRQQGIEDRNLIWHFPYYHPERGYHDAAESIGVGDFRVSKTRPQSALRRGEYKLLWFAETERVELYRITDDPSESQDLSKKNPDKAESMRRRLMSELRRLGARMAEPRSGASR